MRIALVALVGLLVLAAQPTFSATAQQDKMKSCNTDATSKQLKGTERQDFMKTCLSASGTAAKKDLTPQQQKMSDCSKDAAAKSLKGDERKQFMSTCLKAK